MGYNPNVPFVRGNYGLQKLVEERIAKWGKPARYSEYVTGYKSPLNFSGHNADSNGIAHAVDIFVGPGNLTHAQGDELFAAVQREGLEGLVLGHPKRATYVIFNHTIAGDKTGWKAVPYTGPDPHTDHVHISSIDLFYGDQLPSWYGPADYDSTISWNLSTVAKPQSGTTTPIKKEGFLMALTDKEQKELLDKTRELHRDYIQGVPGRNSDGDSFTVLRSILNAVKGKPIDEAARRKKVTGK